MIGVYASKITANLYIIVCISAINPTALRKAKTIYNFSLSECNRVQWCFLLHKNPKDLDLSYKMNLDLLDRFGKDKKKLDHKQKKHMVQ